MTTKKMSKMNEYVRNRMQKCSKAAKGIYEQARCLVQAIDAKPKTIDPTRISHIQNLHKVLAGRQKNIAGALIQSESHHIDTKPNEKEEK
uniref:Uncharacterized protein n=1 Tax=Elaeophora elaphi TaxID=1147741 RepID=A0A0R3RP67_9BILA